MATSTKLRNDIETWKREHDAAMEYWSVQQEVTDRLDYLSHVRALDERWSVEVETGKEKFDEEFVRYLHSVYAEWNDSCAEIEAKIARVQRKGRAVGGASEHRRACEQVDAILSFPADDLIESMKQAEAGQTRPLLRGADGMDCKDNRDV